MSVRRVDLITLAARCNAVIQDVVVTGLASDPIVSDKIRLYLQGRVRMQELVEQCQKLIAACEEDGYS